MNYRIETMDSIRTVGVVLHTTNDHMQGYREIPAFWEENMKKGLPQTLHPCMNLSPFGLLGINVYNTDKKYGKKFDYYIACATTSPAPEGMTEYIVPAATWAVFPCKKEELTAVEVQIVTNWQPTSGYELINSGYESGDMRGAAPDLERYLPDGSAEVWVAVKKNER